MLTCMVTTVGERLKRAREEAKLSQQELAVKIGVTRSAIAQVESGISNSLNAENLTKAARELGKNAVWLASGEGEEHSFDTLAEAIQEMPAEQSQQSFDFIIYQIQNNVVPYLEEPKARKYVDMIDRLKRDRERLRKGD
jgi:transcriptional regulator with XRE-family HTH domain